MMRSVILAITAFGIFANGIALAIEQPISCPKRLEPDAIQSQHPPAGWELHMLRPVYLTEGGMLHGAPEELAFLVPDGNTRRRIGKQTTETQHWSFDLPHGHTLWMYCGYGGSGATLKLFKQVPESASECTLSSISTKSPIMESVQLVCR
ncbi:hypothetical protein GTP23_19785 [Pseudoduganella sp. FT93W]|uniref:Uncharacterized protein n=1 Tax=Duganella fentianensis TaxID=2692177 RepID=A0A845I6T9_9BURK|nr:STY0301 family protein [Duganella fentianensis]MYN47288.1 hypothetical protein [Duganella fentianensis]